MYAVAASIKADADVEVAGSNSSKQSAWAGHRGYCGLELRCRATWLGSLGKRRPNAFAAQATAKSSGQDDRNGRPSVGGFGGVRDPRRAGGWRSAPSRWLETAGMQGALVCLTGWSCAARVTGCQRQPGAVCPAAGDALLDERNTFPSIQDRGKVRRKRITRPPVGVR